MENVDYIDTFIAVAPDSLAMGGVIPPVDAQNPSPAARAFEMIFENPYVYTSADVIFSVWADRQGIPSSERTHARVVFFSRGRACLRASELGKRFGWGVHADGRGRLALYAVDSTEYRDLVSGRALRGSGPARVTKAMRSARAK